MDKTRIVFDVDDTICSNTRRLGYENCVPDLEVIKKINHLHDDLGFEIVLHTSRGMISCGGDIEKIIAKNKRVLEDWLKRHNVHYDELIFCKPIADLYVDDRALNIDDFKKESFEVIKGGGSGKKVLKLGNIIKKDLGSELNTTMFKDWVEDNEGLCKYPKVISYLYDSVYMEYIEGTTLADDLNTKDFINVINTIVGFSYKKKSKCDINIQLDILEKNLSNDEEMNLMINLCKKLIMNNETFIANNASYSHGDMILSNIIKSNDGELYFIDSRYSKESSSYLFDFAKLRMSISGYEYEFGISKNSQRLFLYALDAYLECHGILEVVKILQLMYVLRLYRYKDEVGKLKVKKIAKELIFRNEELFSGK